MLGHGISPPTEGHLPSLGGANDWLNSPPLTADGVRGKVVVVNFCTYTCINWLRSLPYVRAWDEAYRDHGLVTIGVHTPEFSFEHDLENIRQALRETRVEYPIAIDNDYAVWEAFANHYWPALYFIDAEGRIRHHAFGEGDYERSESVIQMLLAEAGLDDGDEDFVSVDARGPEAPADWNSLLSAETYLGYARTMDFASPGGLTQDESRRYEAPQKLRPQPLEPLGRLDGPCGVRRVERSGWTDRVRGPCARRPPRDGSAVAGGSRAVPRDPRWRAAGGRPRERRRRRRVRASSPIRGCTR